MAAEKLSGNELYTSAIFFVVVKGVGGSRKKVNDLHCNLTCLLSDDS